MKLPRFFVGKNITDQRRISLNVPEENVLSLRKKDDFKIEINLTKIKDFLTKNKKLAGPLSIIVLVLIIFSVALKGKASIVNFYPETCLGGWENPSNASGQPSVSSEAQGADFTRDNSAFLKNRTAQMFCGDFGGEVPEDSIPRKFTVRMSWFVDDGSYDKGETIENKALDVGRVLDTTAQEELIHESVDGGTESNQNTEGENTPSTEVEPDQSVSEDESSDTEQVPSNEGTSSDLPAGDTNEPSADSPSTAPESPSSSSDSDSSAPESSGAEGAFFQSLISRAFAQESETPAPEVAEDVSVKEESIETTDTSTETTNKDPETTEKTLESDTGNSEAVTSVEDTPVDSSEPTQESEVHDTNGIVSLDETSRDDLFRVMYTIDGANWEELGVVKRNNWKNVEFEIPFSNVDSWEKLSKVQVAIESLPTIDSFPETYLDSLWVSVEYENANPDPLPQPDFLTDKVLNDIRYENYRVIKIMKPDGEHQLWYAFIPPSLLEVVDSNVTADDVIKTGDSGLQVIDASTLSSYDPLIGPLFPEPEKKDEDPNPVESESTTSPTIETEKENTAPPSEDVQKNSSVMESVLTSPEVLGESVSSVDAINAESVSADENNKTTQEEKSPFDKVDSLFNLNPEPTPTEGDEKKETEKDIPVQEVLNEEIIKQEGEKTDLKELNQPEWHWNLVAKGPEIHPEYEISVDNFVLFWVNTAGDAVNSFNLSGNGGYSSAYFELTSNVCSVLFVTGGGNPRYAHFNRETKQFSFSDQ